uniref:Uncharacterized protein n=1 Tax=Rhipicephalus zambeziensis TaxID=60191 RepID=A0A224Y5B7_9ACAR
MTMAGCEGTTNTCVVRGAYGRWCVCVGQFSPTLLDVCVGLFSLLSLFACYKRQEWCSKENTHKVRAVCFTLQLLAVSKYSSMWLHCGSLVCLLLYWKEYLNLIDFFSLPPFFEILLFKIFFFCS